MRSALPRQGLAAILLLAATFANAVTPMVASRSYHALVLKSDGTVAAWGGDSDGQVGVGRVLFDATPRIVEGVPPLVDVNASNGHVVAVDTNGRVWAWGSNSDGQLGQRAQKDSTKPGRVQGIADVVQACAAASFSVARKRDGTVWLWGGAAGLFPVALDPVAISGIANAAQIACGSGHVAVRRTDGTVVAFGANNWGQLGDGTRVASSLSPVAVPGLSSVVYVAAGWQQTLAITADGKVWAWGKPGLDFYGQGITTPAQVTGLPAAPVKVVARDYSHVLLADGTHWQFGSDLVVSSNLGFTNLKDLAVSGFGAPTVIGLHADGKLRGFGTNAYGEMGLGDTRNTYGGVVTIPGPSPVSKVDIGDFFVFAIAANGQLWSWGKDAEGVLGRGSVLSYAAPRAVGGISNIIKVAASYVSSVALDASGNVWAWGSNLFGEFGNGTNTPSAVPVQVPIANVTDISGSWSGFVFLKGDGKAYMSGLVAGVSSGSAPAEIKGLPPIGKVSAGWQTIYAISTAGDVWAFGENTNGQIGDGTFIQRQVPVRVGAIDKPVVQVAADMGFAMALDADGNVWGWGAGDRHLMGDGTSADNPTPRKIPGVTGVKAIAAGREHFLALRLDGTILSWGGTSSEELGRLPGDNRTAAPVEEIDQVISIAGGMKASFAIREDGSVWAWGTNRLTGVSTLLGDGTFVVRLRPVVVLREDAAGSLDKGDWFLDAKPGTPKTIPAAKVPKMIANGSSLSGSVLLNIDASVSVKQSDQSKTVGLYVMGLVPPAFLKQVPTAAGAHAKVAGLKADQLVLVNLTPAGWTVASGQLDAFRSGTGNALLGASNLLVNVNPATIPGARFCIGYGESASDMLSTGTIRDFLSLEGATASAFGLPCLLSGVYMDGPHTSPKGSVVPIRAVVVGQSPTGNVRFRERFRDISGDVSITALNSAVADARLSYTPPAVGEYAFGAAYGGDAGNVAVASEIPLRHVVQAVQTGSTTKIDAPVTSEVGMELRLVAAITGNRPGGTVQFKRGAANEGSPVPVIDDQAVTSVVGLGIGDFSFTASYGGDANNQASTSAIFTHKVLDVATSAVSLASSANPASLGSPVTLTATTTGTNPSGAVTLREGATLVETKALANGAASFTLSRLGAGQHVFSVDYPGDANNPAATSNAVFQQVALTLDPKGDLDGDGIPNGVESGEGLNPDVKDNDLFVNSRLFAMQQYRDFLSREGDAAGVTFWAAQMNAGTQTRAQMVEAYFNSTEFQGVIAPVARLYFAYFLRIPDYGGLNYWIGQARSGQSLEQVSNAFATSAEFVARYGSLSNAQFVSLVYQNVLGRAPDAAGLAYWAGQLTTLTRGQMMAQFSESAEYQALIGSEVYVTMMYYAMLRRAPDAAGFTYWVDYLDKGNSGAALINGFLAAPEYRSRFLP